MVATPELNLGGDSRRILVQAGDTDHVSVPNGGAVLKADFIRVDGDLLIDPPHGGGIVVKDYFAQEHLPDLLLDNGARLTGDLITRLAGPSHEVQFAADQSIQADLAQANSGEAIGKVDALTGTVNVQHADGTSAQLGQGDPIYLHDVVQAAADGSVGIVFIDGTTFSLSAGARMTMDDMVYNPGGDGNNFVTSVLQGTFVFKTGSIAPNGNMEVNTPVGTIGIRGTTVAAHLALEGSDTVIMLLQDPDGHVGRVVITNGAGTQELTQANAATTLTSFFITPSEPIILPGEDVLRYFDDVLQQLRTIQGAGPADDQGGAIKEGNVGDQGALDNFDPSGFSTAAGGEQPGQPPADGTETIEKLSDLLGFIPDPSLPVSFLTISLFGNVATATIVPVGSTTPYTGNSDITLDNLDPTSPTTTPGTPGSSFTFFTGGAGNDTLDASNSGPSIISGLGGDDTLTGSESDDQISGGDGNDLIVGGHGGGNDTIDGGTGTDTVRYASADESIIVNLTTGTASGDPDIGIDSLANIENVIGGSGNDALIGNGERNQLYGGLGDDQLSGLGNDDTLDGAEGTDTAVYTGNASDYIISFVPEGGYIEVADQRANGDGTDTIQNIEFLRFADQTVRVSDLEVGINRAPTAIALSNATVVEHTDGAIVGALQVTDPDSEDSFTFTLSDNRFEVVEGNLQLKAGESLSADTEPTVTVEVTATDTGGLSKTETLVVSVTNVDDAPSAPVDVNNAGNAVTENAAAGTVVGITAQSSDPDGGAITYSLGESAAGLFVIDAQSGIITVAQGATLDYEGGSSYEITVYATSGDLTASQSFTVNLTDINEAPSAPIDADTATLNQVSENAVDGTVVGITAQAADPDANDTVTYSLRDDAGGRFAIDSVTGVVTVANAALLDAGAAPSHEIVVVATDSGGLTSTETFTIAVTPVEEGIGPLADIDAGPNEISENALAGTGVNLTVQGIDGNGDTVTYSLSDDAGGRFVIDAGTGTVSLAQGASLDYETTQSYNITVQAASSDQQSVTSESFTINVTDANEAPTSVIDIDPTGGTGQHTIDENAANGTAIGITAFAVDPDQNDTATYRLENDFGGLFAIDPDSGVVTVADHTLLNYEGATNFYTIKIIATDSGGLESSATFGIGVHDVNEPPVLSGDLDPRPDSIAEDAVAGTPVGLQISAGDPDLDNNVQFRLSDSANGLFQIDANTGVVTVAEGAVFDYETATSYDITVQAYNSGGASSSVFTINITNVNEAPTGISDTNSADNIISLDAPIGSEIGITAQANDSDGGDTFTYSLAWDYNGAFAIDPHTGVVTLANSSYLSGALFNDATITVQAEDAGGLITTQNFQIDVVEANEGGDQPPVVENHTLTIANDGIDQVGADELSASNGDTAPTAIVYTLVSLAATGNLLLNNVLLGIGDSFTQADIDNGHLQLDGFATENLEDSFVVDITDGSATLANQTININIVHTGTFSDGDTSMPNTDPLIVGDTGYGRVDNLSDSLSVNALVLGNQENSYGVMRINASILSVGSNGIVVGKAGTGQLIALEGGVINTSNQMIIGELAGSSGLVDIANDQSKLFVMGDNGKITVGLDGSGTLNIVGGADVAALKMDIGGGSGIGSVLVQDTGSTLRLAADFGSNTENPQLGGILRIGRLDGSDGTLEVRDGGHVDVNGGVNAPTAAVGITIAEMIGSQGHVVVDGAGSEIEVANNPTAIMDPSDEHAFLQGPWITIGQMGQADVVVSHGGRISVAGNEAYLGIGGGNFDSPDDTTPLPESSLLIESGGKVTVTETLTGNAVTNWAGVYIGDMKNGNGSVIVRDAGSSLEVYGTSTALVVGNNGTGSLSVQNGAMAGALYMAVGQEAGSIGTVNITGAGSQILLSNDYGLFLQGEEPKYAGSATIGGAADSQGNLNITAGGSLVISEGQEINTDTVSPWLNIAHEYGSIGTVIVDGTNSNITIGNLNSIEAGMTVGEGGTGSLLVSNNAYVLIQGEGSGLSVGGGWNNLPGEIATGTLAINSGARVEVTSSNEWGGVWVGDGAQSVGIVTVNGAGSEFLIDTPNGLNVGLDGDGSVLVSQGGTINVLQGGIVIGMNEGGTGIMTIDGVGSVVNSGGDNNFNALGSNGFNTPQFIETDDGPSSGTLVVQNGGAFNGLDLRVGREGTGLLSITGNGSTVKLSTDLGKYTDDPDTSFDESTESGFLRVGQSAGSLGTVQVLAGAMLLITNDTLTGGPGMQVGWGEGSTGNVLVDGIGSTINIIETATTGSPGWGAYLEMGVEGVGSMVVSNGGTVNVAGDDAYVSLGSGFGSFASLSIIGADSSLNLSGEDARLELGGYHEQGNSVAFLNVGNGAVLDVDSMGAESVYNIYVHAGSLMQTDNATINGSIQIDGGTLQVGQGTTTISGDLGLVSSGFHASSFMSTISIAANGLESYNHGSLAVDGFFSMRSGVFEFDFNGYHPQDGALFNFLQAGGVDILDADIGLIAKGVSEDFDFKINTTSTTVGFEALNDSTNGDYIVAKGGNQNDHFDGDDGFYLNASGGAGNDDLLAGNRTGAGHHTLDGGTGADTMTGGNGEDHFYVASTADNYSVGGNVDAATVNSTNYDRIFQFDASTDKVVFDALYDGTGGWNAGHNFTEGTDFSTISGTYDGTNATSSEYNAGHASLVLDGDNNLIYDDNGAAEGYTIVAHIDPATNSPAVTAHNVQVA